MKPKSINRRRFVNQSLSIAAGGGAFGALAARHGRAQSHDSAQLKKAVILSMVSGGESMDDKFRLIKETGFHGVEIGTQNDPKQVEAIGQAAEQHQIAIHSVMNMDHWKYPLSDPDPEVVRRSVQGIKTSLDNAAAWGAETVLLVPAVVTAEVRYIEAMRRSKEQIRRLLPLAEERGVVLTVENVWNKFLLSPLEFAEYVDRFDSPYLKAYFDVGNIVLYGYPQDWIRTLGERIVKVHIKGFKRVSGGYEWTQVRDGDINWPEVRAALDEVNYNGYLTAEVSGGDQAYLQDLSQRMDKIIAGV